MMQKNERATWGTVLHNEIEKSSKFQGQ